MLMFSHGARRINSTSQQARTMGILRFGIYETLRKQKETLNGIKVQLHQYLGDLIVIQS